jgi:type IV pilus assembly protein PilA
MLQRIRNRKGFTLVELMIVVAIIGILAAIAIPNFLSFRLKAKTSEAKSNLGAIRSTEVAYFAEWNWYVGNQTDVPLGARTGRADKVPWIPSTRFSVIGFAPEGAVFYDYALVSNAIYSDSTVVQGLTMNAIGDLDADSVLNTFYLTHTTNDIFKIPAAGGVY